MTRDVCHPVLLCFMPVLHVFFGLLLASAHVCGGAAAPNLPYLPYRTLVLVVRLMRFTWCSSSPGAASVPTCVVSHCSSTGGAHQGHECYGSRQGSVHAQARVYVAVLLMFVVTLGLLYVVLFVSGDSQPSVWAVMLLRILAFLLPLYLIVQVPPMGSCCKGQGWCTRASCILQTLLCAAWRPCFRATALSRWLGVRLDAPQFLRAASFAVPILACLQPAPSWKRLPRRPALAGVHSFLHSFALSLLGSCWSIYSLSCLFIHYVTCILYPYYGRYGAGCASILPVSSCPECAEGASRGSQRSLT